VDREVADGAGGAARGWPMEALPSWKPILWGGAKVGEHRCFGNAWNSGWQPFCGVGLAMHKSRRLLY